MNSRDLSLLVITVLAISGGQVCFKIAAPAFSALSIRSMFEPMFIIALVIYAAATILWVICLSRIPLTQAYPVIALSYVIVPVLAQFLLGESSSIRTFLGAAIVIVGVYVSVSDKVQL